VKHDGHSWRAVVQRKDIGKFNNMVEAAKAYDEVAPKVFGEFALTNQMLIDRGVRFLCSFESYEESVVVLPQLSSRV